MLISVSKLKEINDFKEIAEDELKREIKAVEKAIRSHTHNNFQNRLVRTSGSSENNKIKCKSPFFEVGDTVEISQSVNKGLYVIESIEDGYITLDSKIYDFGYNLVTKIEYPEDIISGAIDLLKWKYSPEAIKSRNGVASESETISRHSQSTTYKNYDSNNTINGYPAELFGFCKPYIKARF